MQFYHIYQETLEMLLPTIQKVAKLRKIFLGTKTAEVVLVDKPLTQRKVNQYACPVEDLRLADQMLRYVF